MDDALLEILLFQSGYNTNLVLISTLALGAAAGLVGAFIFLRGRTLISDAVSHATLPGIAIGFLIAFTLGLDGGKHLPTLMIGAGLTGMLSALTVQWIHKNTRLNEDVAIGSVLSVFYGAGVVLLSFIQRLDGASQAGLDGFLLGQVTGLSYNEALVIIGLSICTFLLCLLSLKDLTLLCFDREYAHSIGKSIQKLDVLLIALMLAVVCTGLKTVGLILILALLIIPPVTARLWTDRLQTMLIIGPALGALSCYIGASLSAYLTNIPTGGAIVLTGAVFFFISFILSPKRGIIALHFGKVKHA